eukprot:scaffold256512_cov19-Tisochrysis_lutea.AAC.1
MVAGAGVPEPCAEQCDAHPELAALRVSAETGLDHEFCRQGEWWASAAGFANNQVLGPGTILGTGLL